MRFYKFISTILHPIVIPSIGVMLYFLLLENIFEQNQKLSILVLVFVITYLIPLISLILLKRLKIVKSFELKSIKERKIPITLMIFLFYLLSNTLNSIPNLKDLEILFLASSIGLMLVYLLFYFKMKASIHLLSLGLSAGFFMILSDKYSQSFLLIIVIIILLSGILASARLHLKAHTNKEIYLGFFIGLISIYSVYLFL